MIYSRIATDFVLGPEASRDTEWCRMAANVSYNTMSVGLLLKKLPSWFRPLVARMLPRLQKLRESQVVSAELVAPILERWRSGISTSEDKVTLLYWMLEHAQEHERTAVEMSYRVNFAILASVHATSMTLTSIIFNLCAHPEYFDILRDEIAQTKKELGAMGEAGPETLQKQFLAKLEKMDSFIAETLRLHQPLLCKLYLPFPTSTYYLTHRNRFAYKICNGRYHPQRWNTHPQRHLGRLPQYQHHGGSGFLSQSGGL